MTRTFLTFLVWVSVYCVTEQLDTVGVFLALCVNCISLVLSIYLMKTFISVVLKEPVHYGILFLLHLLGMESKGLK